MPIIVLDASVLIAHLNGEDAHHAVAEAFFTENAGAEFLMHTVNVAEILVVPMRMHRAEQAARMLHGMGIAEWNHEPGEARHLAELRVETDLRMPDVCALDTALRNSAALATFDARLAKAARRLGVRVFP